MKKGNLLIDILEAAQAMSNELGQRVDHHSKAATSGDLLDLSEMQAAYIAYGGIIALHDLMEIVNELLNEEEKSNEHIKENDETK